MYGPVEAGLGCFVDLGGPDFIGRDDAAREKEDGPRRRLVTFTVDATDADVIGDEPIWRDGAVVGWVTSGGYAHHRGRSVALGYVPSGMANDGAFEIEILGERRPARPQATPLFDPEG